MFDATSGNDPLPKTETCQTNASRNLSHMVHVLSGQGWTVPLDLAEKAESSGAKLEKWSTHPSAGLFLSRIRLIDISVAEAIELVDRIRANPIVKTAQVEHAYRLWEP